MKISVRSRYRSWWQFAVSGLLLGVIISQVDFDQVLSLLRNADQALLLVLLAVFLADRVLMAYKWHLLLDVYHRFFSLYEAIRIYYISSFIGLALPLGGIGSDIVRFWSVRQRGVPTQVNAAAIIMERGIGIIATLLAAVASGVLLFVLVSDRDVRHMLTSVLWGAGFLAIASLLVLFHPVARKHSARLTGLTKLAANPRIQTFLVAFSHFKNHKRTLTVVFLLSLVEQLMPVLAVFLSAQALSLPISLLEALAVVPISTILERAPISFAGIGLREGAYVVLFGFLGVQLTDAVLVSIVTFFLFILSLLPGAIWSLTSGFSVRDINVDKIDYS